jgi:hypothetical protein
MIFEAMMIIVKIFEINKTEDIYIYLGDEV